MMDTAIKPLSPPCLIRMFYFAGQPVVYPVRRNVTALGGSQLSLAVEFCANPAATHSFWLTTSVVLMPGQQGGGYIAQNLTVRITTWYIVLAYIQYHNHAVLFEYVILKSEEFVRIKRKKFPFYLF